MVKGGEGGTEKDGYEKGGGGKVLKWGAQFRKGKATGRKRAKNCEGQGELESSNEV